MIFAASISFRTLFTDFVYVGNNMIGIKKTSLQKVVIPAKAGIHVFTNYLKKMDSRLRGNDTQVPSRLFVAVSSRRDA
jgi:hypothetical protein